MTRKSSRASLFANGAGVLAPCALAACALAACASPGVPPGGPVDTEAPKIVQIAPDSGKTGTTPREVIFRFDEVVNERPSGAASLAALFLISPRDGEPRVEWNRDEISVRPRRGWRANTAYTITLLPGLSDLRGNTRNTGVVTIFSTGATIPAGRISGTIYDWPQARVIQRAVIQARPSSDTTLVYVATSDSIGNFVIGPLPPGPYQVRGFSDDNSNKGLDPREAWDSAAISATDSSRTDIFAFVHDSIGTRIAGVTPIDSVTLEVTFDNPVAPLPLLSAANVRVRASDSTEVRILSVVPPPADSVTPGVSRMSKPVPIRSIIVKLQRPLVPRTDYRVSVNNVMNLSGVARSSEKTFRVPVPQPAQPAPQVVPPAAPPPAGSVKR